MTMYLLLFSHCNLLTKRIVDGHFDFLNFFTQKKRLDLEIQNFKLKTKISGWVFFFKFSFSFRLLNSDAQAISNIRK